MQSFRSTAVPVLQFLLLSLCATGAWAIDAPRAEAHQLWVAHLLAASVAGGLGFVLARWPAMAGIAFVGLLGYAVSRVLDAGAADVALQLGRQYRSHMEVTALLLPLAFGGGFMAALTMARQRR